MSAAAVFNAMVVSLLNLWQGRARDTVMGYQATAGAIGGILWPILGGALGGISWQGPFTVYLVALPIAAAAAWLVPDSRPVHSTRASTEAVPRMGTLLRRTPMLRGLYALVFALAVLLYTVVVFVPQRLAQLGVTDPLVVSLFIAATTAPAGLVGLVYGRLRRHLRYRPIFLAGLSLPAAGFVILAAATTPWVLLVGTPLLGLGMGLIMPAAPVLVGEVAPDQARGRATSYLNSLMLIGQFASPLLLGALAEAYGIQAAFLTAAALAVLAAVSCAARFHPDRPSGISQPAETGG